MGALAACGCAAVAVWNPADDGVRVCWSQALFGLDCPLCGGLRVVNSLVRGDWLAAADHNVLLAVAVPVAAVLWAVWLVTGLRGRPHPTVLDRLGRPPTAAVAAIVAVLVTFTVVRNLPSPDWAVWLNSATYRS